MTKYPDDFVHPVYGRVVHGVVVDEQAIQPVPDGSKRLNETHGVLFPIADPGPVKMVPPRKAQGTTNGDERDVIDTPEFTARQNAPLLPWLQLPKIDSPEYRETVKSGRAIEYKTLPDVADPLERAHDERYRIAGRLRAMGQPYDAEIIALYTSPEWRNGNFRAAWYAKLREKQKHV
jgi:hypothetical protein